MKVLTIDTPLEEVERLYNNPDERYTYGKKVWLQCPEKEKIAYAQVYIMCKGEKELEEALDYQRNNKFAREEECEIVPLQGGYTAVYTGVFHWHGLERMEMLDDIAETGGWGTYEKAMEDIRSGN